MKNTNHKKINQIFKRSQASILIMGALCTAYAGIANSADTEKLLNEKAAKTTNEKEEKNEKEDQVEVIEVSGIRSNLTAAQFTKRHANTLIDSISAEDLGDFPDKSVADALQRVPGITVERFGSRTDTKAFSVEPSGVLVRGLTQVRSEFNGRDTFSANSSRGLSWGDISPELMGGIDVYKNQTAELIEGGIAGSINLRTRLPFDSEGETAALNIAGNYSDLTGTTTPEISGIYTNRFDTDLGEFGVMANVAYSDVDATAQSSRTARIIKYRGIYGDPDELHYINDRNYVTDDEYTRQRLGTSFAAQWQDNEGDFLATFQFNRSQKDSERHQQTIGVGMSDPFFAKSLHLEVVPGGDGYATALATPAEGSDPFTFDENGLLQTGTITLPHGWWGADNAGSSLRAVNSNGEALIETCAGEWAGCGPETTQLGAELITVGQYAESKSVTEDYGFNLIWHVTDEIHANFDVQYVDATYEEYSIESLFRSFADPTIDLTGDTIDIVLAPGTNANLVDAGQGVFANPNNYYIREIMDMLEDSEGTEFAARADFVFDMHNEFIENIKTGIRYADREQNVNKALNWANVANTWTDGSTPFFNVDSPASSGDFNGTPYDFSGYPSEAYAIEEWTSNFGSMTTLDGNNLFVMPNVSDMKNWKNTMGAVATGNPLNTWNPICSGLGLRAGEQEGECFLPVEQINVSEESTAAYVQVNLGGDDFTLFGKQLSGNLGLRYVRTEVFSSGGEKFAQFTANTLECRDNTPDPDNPDNTQLPRTLGCYLSDDDIAYNNGGQNEGSVSTTHHNVLPSLNLKMDLTDKLLVRLALSRAMSRPDIGSLRNYIDITALTPNPDNPDDPTWVKDAQGEIIGANTSYSSTASNPKLKPITADQIDLSLEYYADTGSASIAIFSKDFKDYIQSGVYTRELTNNGVTNIVTVVGPVNGDGAKMSGFELQGTKWADFLPAPFNGLGIQANYTFIENDGIQNTGLNSGQANGSISSGHAPDFIEVDSLEGLSKHAYNLTLMYANEDFEAKMAYSWRDDFMVTNSDCCIAYPVWQNDYGQLDASIRYEINDMFELSLSANNLTGEEAVLTQQVQDSSAGGLKLPYSRVQSDTRYTASVRVTF